MRRVNMMDFFTHCCKSARLSFYRLGRRVGLRWLLLALALGWLQTQIGVMAQSAAEVPQLQLEQQEEAWVVSASMQWQLPAAVQQALYKGLPVQFVMQADLVQPRWYWRDARVAQARRYLRLSYQPLTRRWRVLQSSSPVMEAGGLGLSLSQQFDDLDGALASMQRVARWKVADAAQVDSRQPHVLQFDFRLDASQLPRPLQFGNLGRSGWSLHVWRSLPLAAQED